MELVTLGIIGALGLKTVYTVGDNEKKNTIRLRRKAIRLESVAGPVVKKSTDNYNPIRDTGHESRTKTYTRYNIDKIMEPQNESRSVSLGNNKMLERMTIGNVSGRKKDTVLGNGPKQVTGPVNLNDVTASLEQARNILSNHTENTNVKRQVLDNNWTPAQKIAPMIPDIDTLVGRPGDRLEFSSPKNVKSIPQASPKNLERTCINSNRTSHGSNERNYTQLYTQNYKKEDPVIRLGKDGIRSPRIIRQVDTVSFNSQKNIGNSRTNKRREYAGAPKGNPQVPYDKNVVTKYFGLIRSPDKPESLGPLKSTIQLPPKVETFRGYSRASRHKDTVVRATTRPNSGTQPAHRDVGKYFTKDRLGRDAKSVAFRQPVDNFRQGSSGNLLYGKKKEDVTDRVERDFTERVPGPRDYSNDLKEYTCE